MYHNPCNKKIKQASFSSLVAIESDR